MTEPKQPRGATLGNIDEFGHWDLPDISQEIAPDSLNMFGRQSLQVQTEEDVETETILPPTLSEIEDIRAHAEQEGFTEGQDKGYSEGLEKGRLEGLEQGHGEGFSQGQQQGYEEGLKSANEMLQRFEGLLAQFEAPLAILDTEIEKELLSTATTLAKAVIGHELKTHPEHILAALRQGVDSLPIKEQKVNIRLAPSDQQLVVDLYTPEQLARNHWEIESDPSLAPGDCIINSGRSHIDMSVETRIQHVFSELDKHQQDLLQLKEQQQDELEADRQLKASEYAQTMQQQAALNNTGLENDEGMSPNDSGKTVDIATSAVTNEGEHDHTPTPTA